MKDFMTHSPEQTEKLGSFVAEWSSADHRLYADWLDKLEGRLDPWVRVGHEQWVDTVWDRLILPTNVSEYLATR
jgi:hypothetical protein